MKRTFFFIGIMFQMLTAFGQWKPAGDKIRTEWANQVNPNQVF